jgi:hypothetical protein
MLRVVAMPWSLVLAWICTGVIVGAHHVQAHYDVLVTVVRGLARVTTLRERVRRERERGLISGIHYHVSST